MSLMSPKYTDVASPYPSWRTMLLSYGSVLYIRIVLLKIVVGIQLLRTGKRRMFCKGLSFINLMKYRFINCFQFAVRLIFVTKDIGFQLLYRILLFVGL